MSVKLSLLAILDQGPCYGNQLRAEFERRTAGAWSLNVGQVYTTLDRLERDGLATRLPSNEAGHVLYAITEAGRADVRDWLISPVKRSVVTRDEFVVKLALSMTLAGSDPAALIQTQRLQERAVLRDAEERIASTPGRLIHESARLHARAQLDWLDYCEELLESREVMALSTEQPRRGRPARAS